MPTKKKPPPPLYVLCVEAGREQRVKRDILRRVRKAGLTKDVRRVVVPTELREVVAYGVKGEVLASGEAETFTACRTLADDALYGYENHDHLKVKFRKHPDKPGWWTFTLRERNARGVVKQVRVPKYPGYVVLQLNYTPAVSGVIENTRDAFGLLLRPVALTFKTALTYSKRRGGWVWKLKTDGGEVVASGVELGRELARTKAAQARATAEEFKPTPLADMEAAELLMRERAMNRKEDSTMTPVVDFAVGDTVTVVGGAWAGREVTVEALNGTPQSPAVLCRVEVLGVKVDLTLPAREVRKK